MLNKFSAEEKNKKRKKMPIRIRSARAQYNKEKKLSIAQKYRREKEEKKRRQWITRREYPNREIYHILSVFLMINRYLLEREFHVCSWKHRKERIDRPTRSIPQPGINISNMIAYSNHCHCRCRHHCRRLWLCQRDPFFHRSAFT